MKSFLQELFTKTGAPAFIVNVKGIDITKGVRRLEIPDVSDIGHELANGSRASAKLLNFLPLLEWHAKLLTFEMEFIK